MSDLSEFRTAPLVSVVVPAFNHQEYIEHCLDSIAESSYAPLEILVIDDGSTDDTYARAREWAETNRNRVSRVTVCRQENQGVTRTLNALVSRARGEYVAVLGSDDALEPEGIAMRVSALEGHPEWLAVFGDCSIIDGAGRQRAASALESMHNAHLVALMNPRRIARELILRWSVPGPAMLARRSVYSRGSGVGLYDEDSQVEDRDFYLRLLSIEALGFVNERVARYRLHGDNSVLANNSVVTRDMILAEWRNARSFRGLNRWLLTLVALRGMAALRANRDIERGDRKRAKAFRFLGRILEIVRRGAYVLHRLVDTSGGK